MDDPIAPGAEIEPEKFTVVEVQLERFGFSVYRSSLGPIVEGRWSGQTDMSYLYEVVAQRFPEHEAFFLELYVYLKEQFRQRDIFMTKDETTLAVAEEQI